MNDYQTKKDSFVENLNDCLHEAQKSNLQRLIVPLIYSGSGGVSLKDCAFFYACAIYEFCRETRETFLGPYEIYFVEHDKKKAESLMSFFNAMFPTSSTQLMAIPNEYDRVNLMAAHVYENQPHPPRVTVNSAYEPIELRVKEETAKTNVDNLKLRVEGESENAVPGRRSTEVDKKEENKQSDRTSASPAYEDIDSESVYDIDEGPAHMDNTFQTDIIPNIVHTNEKIKDYEEIPDNRLNLKTNAVQDHESKPRIASETSSHANVNVHMDQGKKINEEPRSGPVVQSKVSGPRREREISDAKPFKDQCLFERSKTKLVIKMADIREEEVDVIVCPEYQTVDFTGFIPNGIRCRFGIGREAIEEKVFQAGRIAASRIPEGSKMKKVKYVYHVKASLFQCGKYPITRNSEDNLRHTVEKVFDKLHRLKRSINSIAFSLIGSVDVADKELVKLLCSHFLNAIFTCCDKRCDPDELEVLIVNPCATITRWLQESLYKKWNAGCSLTYE